MQGPDVSVRRRGLVREEGFTLIEMTIAISIVAVSFLSLSLALLGGLKALAAARQRSVYGQIANCVMESLRSTDTAKWGEPDDPVGVNATADPDYAAAYPSGQFEGMDAVATTATSSDSPAPPPAVKTVSSAADHGSADAPTCAVAGARFPYTIRRWITWTDRTNATYPPGTSPHVFKRLTVQVEWSERGLTPTERLVSTLYPGGLGPSSSAGNLAPTARMTITPASASPGMMVTFDGTASSDPEGNPLTYRWDFGDDLGQTGAAFVTHAYSVAGLRTVQLTVTDPAGASSIASEVIALACDGNSPPVATMSLSPSTGVAPVTVNVDGGASTDPDIAGCGDSLTYDWDWGDGTAHGTGVSASHSYAVPGTYTTRLTVTDAGGGSATVSAPVSATPLNCSVTSGYFRNSETNTVKNDVKANGSGVPSQPSFTFHATSNLACSSLQGKIPLAAGLLTTPLAYTEAGGIRTWTGTASLTSRLNTGSTQTGEIEDAVTAQPSFTFPFCVHTGNAC